MANKIRICPRCESREVKRLPKDGISPHPGYVCNQCGGKMRPNATGIMYAAIMVFALAVGVISLLPWFGLLDTDRLPLGLPVAGFGIALYSLYQLFRPSPKLVNEDELSLDRD
jgi:hypothetical protein